MIPILFLALLAAATIVSIFVALALSDHWKINAILSLGCGICWILNAIDCGHHLNSGLDIARLVLDLWMIVYFFINGLSFLIHKHGWRQKPSQ